VGFDSIFFQNKFFMNFTWWAEFRNEAIVFNFRAVPFLMHWNDLSYSPLIWYFSLIVYFIHKCSTWKTQLLHSSFKTLMGILSHPLVFLAFSELMHSLRFSADM
jgi:hypothetical protein